MIIEDLTFINESRSTVAACFADPKVAEVYQRCLENTLATTIRKDEQGTFVLTGDIPAMWLRDSVCQIRPLLLFAKEQPELQVIIGELLQRQFWLIKQDPYANAFNQSDNGQGHQGDQTVMQPIIWERKYEIDSLCYPLQLAYLFWKVTGQTAHFNEELLAAAQLIVALWQREQHHETQSPYRFERATTIVTDTLPRSGKGSETGYTGMTWSGFRPSDDACTYGYLIPANMFAVVVLGYLEEMLATFYQEAAFLETVRQLKQEIQEGIQRWGIVEHAVFGRIYAYETDGLGHHLLMDDANVPSLLALPFLGYCDKQDPIYQNTRAFILSSANPYFYKGTEANGVGSPHTPVGHVWPIALAIQGLTSCFESEKRDIVNTLMRTDGGKGLMHESFAVDDAGMYTREWFSWANMMYCELVLDIAGQQLQSLIN